MVRMAQQEWQQQGAGNARRRSLETAMKEQQARTKVVVRHLPPSLGGAVFLDQIAAKYAGAFAWCTFHQGKSNHKRQGQSRAYINFKKPEDVIDFYEDFNGHVFVNERGAQYKAAVEYAPYQRVPKPRSKKDVRESSIFKDPEYLAFMEQLAKPVEYLPSAEIQLERKDAEKAAALASGASKDVVVTPLMEYVRLRRAAKSTPQRGMSSGAKLAARSGGASASSYNVISQKRSAEKGRSASSSHAADSSSASKDSVTHSGAPREEIQRKERETLIDRKRKESDGKEKKSVRESIAGAGASARATSANPRVDSSKEKNVLLTKDSSETGSGLELRTLQILSAAGEFGSRPAKALSINGPGESTASGDGREQHKREYKKKQLVAKDKDKESSVVEPGQGAATNGAASGATHSQRHRSSAPSKLAPTAGGQQAQSVQAYRATSPGEVSSGKQIQKQELGSRSSGRASTPQGTSAGSGLDSHAQSLPAATQVEKAGKRPPRPQAIRLAGKEQAVSLVSLEADAQAGNGEEKVVKQVSGVGASMTSASEKQDARRLRNKDRPDRPVWTPRRRDGVAAKGDGTAFSNGATPTGTPLVDGVPGSVQSGTDSGSKSDRMERSSGRQNGKSGSDSRSSEPLQTTGGGGNVTSGKLRYVEAGGRGTRSGRGSTIAAPQDAKADVVNGDGKNQDQKQARENGDVVLQSLEVVQVPGLEDRRKQDASLWSESGGGHRQGGRRDRNGQAIPKEAEGAITGTEVASKLVKRGRGPLPLGSNEKQVWVAVQKTVSG